MASSIITELENQLTKEMGFPPDIAKKAAVVCGEISDQEQRLIAAINFIETEDNERMVTSSLVNIQNQPISSAAINPNKGMKMTVCVRKDLAMSPGKIASQVAHACLQLATNLEADLNRKALVKQWQEYSSEKIVVLECTSLENMSAVQAKASELGVFTAPIADAGRTEVDSGTVTCMGVGPGYEDIIDQITGNLKLYS